MRLAIGAVINSSLNSPKRTDEKSANAAAQTTKIPAIAVLPFADMSPAGDQDFFCDGLAEELINALTRIDGLRVASRTASFQFRSPGADVQSVGRHLNVDRLLEGSVRKADNRLRVTVQLIEVATGYHHWSQRFDRVLDDVFAIQDEIAERVVDSMRGGGPESQRTTVDITAPHTRRGLRVLPSRPPLSAPHDADGPREQWRNV